MDLAVLPVFDMLVTCAGYAVRDISSQLSAFCQLVKLPVNRSTADRDLFLLKMLGDLSGCHMSAFERYDVFQDGLVLSCFIVSGPSHAKRLLMQDNLEYRYILPEV